MCRRRQSRSLVHGIFWAALCCWGVAYGAEPVTCPGTGKLALSNNEYLDVQVAATRTSRREGLSGVPDKAFGPHDAMLFWFEKDGPREFFMRDMHFDLDMISLDADLRVLDVQRGLKAHPGKSKTPPMAVARFKQARHVIELRADSPMAQHIEAGMQLTWVSKPTLAEIGACGKARDDARQALLRSLDRADTTTPGKQPAVVKPKGAGP